MHNLLSKGARYKDLSLHLKRQLKKMYYVVIGHVISDGENLILINVLDNE